MHREEKTWDLNVKWSRGSRTVVCVADYCLTGREDKWSQWPKIWWRRLKKKNEKRGNSCRRRMAEPKNRLRHFPSISNEKPWLMRVQWVPSFQPLSSKDGYSIQTDPQVKRTGKTLKALLLSSGTRLKCLTSKLYLRIFSMFGELKEKINIRSGMKTVILGMWTSSEYLNYWEINWVY